MGLFGGGTAKEGKAMERQAASRYSQLADSLSSLAAPQRSQVSDYYSSIIKGGPEASRVTAPEVADLKRQYAGLDQQIRDKLPAGGAQQRARMQLVAQRPGAISALRQRKVEEALRGLSQLSQANTSGALAANQGVSSSARNFMDLAEKERSQWTNLLGGLGMALGQQAIGGIFSSGPKKLPSKVQSIPIPGVPVPAQLPSGLPDWLTSIPSFGLPSY
jgi:hypothetical protein